MTNEEHIEQLKKLRSIYNGSYGRSINKAIEVLENQKEGVWVSIDEEPHEDYECGKCGYIISMFCEYISPYAEYKFCPSCGEKKKEGGA